MSFNAQDYISTRNNKQLQDIVEFGADLETEDQRRAARAAASQRLASGAAGPQHRDGWSGAEKRKAAAIEQGLLTRPQLEQVYRTNGRRLGIDPNQLQGTQAQAWQDSQTPDGLSLGGTPAMQAGSSPQPEAAPRQPYFGAPAPTNPLPGNQQGLPPSQQNGGFRGSQGTQQPRERPPGYAESVELQIAERKASVAQLPEFQQLERLAQSIQNREPTPQEIAQIEALEEAILKNPTWASFERLARGGSEGLLQQVTG